MIARVKSGRRRAAAEIAGQRFRLHRALPRSIIPAVSRHR